MHTQSEFVMTLIYVHSCPSTQVSFFKNFSDRYLINSSPFQRTVKEIRNLKRSLQRAIILSHQSATNSRVYNLYFSMLNLTSRDAKERERSCVMLRPFHRLHSNTITRDQRDGQKRRDSSLYLPFPSVAIQFTKLRNFHVL